MGDITPLSARVTVGLPQKAAFERFTDGFGTWWPAEFSWSQPALLQHIGMDCRLDGLLSEIGPYSFRIDWGRITSWDPPSSFSLLWQISADRVPIPDPDSASTVSVEFIGAGEKTDVQVTHSAWERHGDGAQAYRDDFEQAWPMALERFQQHAQP